MGPDLAGLLKPHGYHVLTLSYPSLRDHMSPGQSTRLAGASCIMDTSSTSFSQQCPADRQPRRRIVTKESTP